MSLKLVVGVIEVWTMLDSQCWRAVLFDDKKFNPAGSGVTSAMEAGGVYDACLFSAVRGIDISLGPWDCGRFATDGLRSKGLVI